MSRSEKSDDIVNELFVTARCLAGYKTFRDSVLPDILDAQRVEQIARIWIFNPNVVIDEQRPAPVTLSPGEERKHCFQPDFWGPLGGPRLAVVLDF